MNSPFAEHRLDNGLRIVSEVMPHVRSTAIGFFARTGSRHEQPHEHGVSHFLEHMCFKGTETRSWSDINVRFDELGSIYNAYTSKEHTVYYGWVPADRFDPQLELLADMMRPSLPADDFETERKVILEEIAMSADSFDHHVWNFLHETIFGGHPLGHEILGEKATIEQLPRQIMVDYLANRYRPENLVLIASGAIDPEALFRAADHHCRKWSTPNDGLAAASTPELKLNGTFKTHLPQFKQHSVILLYPSVSQRAAEAEDIEAFQSLFGGQNSRCYWNIVQKGICSQAGAAWIAYDDCGMLALYADGEPERCEEMVAALREQAAEVTRGGFRDDEVQRVKNRRRTHLALEAESPRTRFMQLVDDLECYDEPRTAETRLAEVDAVTTDTIARYLERYPITGEGMLLSCGPRDWP